MKLIYIRCNNLHLCEQKEKELMNKDAIIIKKEVTSGKKILKKEIKELKELVEKFNIDKLEVWYLNEESKEVLEKELGVLVQIMDEKRVKEPSKKLKFLFELLSVLKERDLTAEDKVFKGYSKQNALNYLNELEEVFSSLVYSENTKQGKVFKLRRGENIIREIFDKKVSLESIQNLLSSLTDEDIKSLSEETKKFLRSDKDIVVFKTRPFEDLQKEDNIVFRELKEAIRESKFVNIYDYQVAVQGINGYEKENYENVVPLKLVFMENNWYLAGVVDIKNLGEIVRFFRISFIGDIEIGDKIPKKMIKKEYFKFLEEFETPFTLYGAEWKRAVLKVDSSKAFYFEKKEHFPKQKIVRKDEEDNLIIECAYTQPLEILPTLKKWLPFIEVIESEDGEIEKQLKKELQEALNKLS